MTAARLYERRLPPTAGLAILLTIAIGGLFYVKWLPYYHKALLASASHSIGRSILMGTADQAPAPSWTAALDYSLAYGKAIWQAMVLGLLLGSALQEFAPRALVGLIPEYVVLVLILGAARAWLFPHAGPAIGNDLQWIHHPDGSHDGNRCRRAGGAAAVLTKKGPSRCCATGPWRESNDG
jgi:hypothetical protein